MQSTSTVRGNHRRFWSFLTTKWLLAVQEGQIKTHRSPVLSEIAAWAHTIRAAGLPLSRAEDRGQWYQQSFGTDCHFPFFLPL